VSGFFGSGVRRRLLFALASLAFLSLSFAPIPFRNISAVSTEKNELVAEMISKINESEIYNTAYSLQNFTSRKYGYPGNALAAAYLHNRLGNISGLSVEYQGSYNNVIATLPGTDTSSNEVYMVGAHYDSTSSDPTNAPGATDDGAGVGIVLEFARIMSQYNFSHTVKFALWNCEEESSISGSIEYAKYAHDNNINISLYENFDSSCYDPYNRMILDIMSNAQSGWVSDMMTESDTLYNINFTLTYNVHTCYSDHRSFWDYGYTAVMTHSEWHGPQHTPNDTIDQVSTLYAKKNGQLGMSVLATLAEGNTNLPAHDVAVHSVEASKSVVGQGFAFSVYLTVRDQGTSPETFNVTTYANTIFLNRTELTLDSGTEATLNYTFNTSLWAYGNYVITVCADVVSGENVTSNNNGTCASPVHVGVPGDVSSSLEGIYDGVVNMRDVGYLVTVFNARKGSTKWNPNADVNNDGVVNLRDIALAVYYFNKHE
jgi:hypothetical protein